MTQLHFYLNKRGPIDPKKGPDFPDASPTSQPK
jgi:hypothetical protein